MSKIISMVPALAWRLEGSFVTTNPVAPFSLAMASLLALVEMAITLWPNVEANLTPIVPIFI